MLVNVGHAGRLGRRAGDWRRVGVLGCRGRFLGAAAVLALGTLWALWVVPDAFLRFVLIILAATLYRLRVVGRPNVPAGGPALLTPNHVSFADGLFVIASIDRPIRFVVYAEYFKRPLLGRFLRVMKAIPIAGRAGPRMILEAFREAGKALDNGELVCIFPEGQITRTGMTSRSSGAWSASSRGGTCPIIPVHIDRATASIFSPMQDRRLPERIPLPVTVSFGTPLPATTPPSEIRQAIGELDQQAWEYRQEDRRPLHHEFIRRSPPHPVPPGLRRLRSPRNSLTSRRWPGRSPWPGHSGRTGRTRRPWASCCRRAWADAW